LPGISLLSSGYFRSGSYSELSSSSVELSSTALAEAIPTKCPPARHEDDKEP